MIKGRGMGQSRRRRKIRKEKEEVEERDGEKRRMKERRGCGGGRGEGGKRKKRKKRQRLAEDRRGFRIKTQLKLEEQKTKSWEMILSCWFESESAKPMEMLKAGCWLMLLKQTKGGL